MARVRYARQVVRLVHLVGGILLLGSILTFLVASRVGEQGSVVELVAARRIIGEGTSLLTLPGLALLIVSGLLLVMMGTSLFKARSVQLMTLAAAGIVGNGLLLVLPSVRSATALAEESLRAGHLVPGYRDAYTMESMAGDVNIALATIALLAGVLGLGSKKREESPEHVERHGGLAVAKNEPRTGTEQTENEMDRVMKEQKPGLFAPRIDRRSCEGGHHHACAAAQCPCVRACPHSVLEIQPLTGEDKRLLPRRSRFRAWIHGNRQAYATNPDACRACGRCVVACPNHVIKLRRRQTALQSAAVSVGSSKDPSWTP